MVLSAQELFAIEKMAIAGMGNKKIATTLGLPQSTTKWWLQRLRSEGEMRQHLPSRVCPGSRVPCFSTSRRWQKTQSRNGEATIEKHRCTFEVCTFLWARSNFSFYHMWSIHSVFSMIFVRSRFHVFDTQKMVQTEQKGSILETIFRSGPAKFPKAPFRPKKWAYKGPTPSFGGGTKAQNQRATLNVKRLLVGQYQHWVTQDVTIIEGTRSLPGLRLLVEYVVGHLLR